MKLFCLIFLGLVCHSQVWAIDTNSIDHQFTTQTKLDRALISAFPPGANKEAGESEDSKALFAVCSVNPSAKENLRKPITCLAVEDGNWLKLIKGRLIRYSRLDQKPRNSEDYTVDYFEIDQAETRLQPLSRPLFPSEMRTFNNLFSLMSAQRPMHLVFEPDTGVWRYGLNPKNLIQF